MAQFVPRALQKLAPAQKRLLLGDDRLFRAYRDRELRRCEDFEYWLLNYGSLEHPDGSVTPFDAWECHTHVIRLMLSESISVFPKARRMGMTWLPLHYIAWVFLGLSPEHAGGPTKQLVFSKDLEAAGVPLGRLKRIIARLPAWMQPQLVGDSATRLVRPDGSEIRCLSATPTAGTGETATTVLLDEFSKAKNGTAPKIWEEVEPTTEGGGKIFVVGTGNGRVGDGAKFASLILAILGQGTLTQVAKGTWVARGAGMALVFLAWNARPDRDEEWYRAKRERADDDYAFRRNYPTTIDEALSADLTTVVYPPEALAAAVALGKELGDPTPEQVEGLEKGVDWGSFMTASVTACDLPLPGGGLWIVDEFVQSRVEPKTAAERLLVQRTDGLEDVPLWRVAVDISPAGWADAAAEALDDIRGREVGDPDEKWPDEIITVPFGVYKDRRSDSGDGVSTVGYLQRLLHNTLEGHEHRPRLAIHPRCMITIKHFESLMRNPDTGKIEKTKSDPRVPDSGDHCHDAVIALAADRAARRWERTQQVLDEADEETYGVAA